MRARVQLVAAESGSVPFSLQTHERLILKLCTWIADRCACARSRWVVTRCVRNGRITLNGRLYSLCKRRPTLDGDMQKLPAEDERGGLAIVPIPNSSILPSKLQGMMLPSRIPPGHGDAGMAFSASLATSRRSLRLYPSRAWMARPCITATM